MVEFSKFWLNLVELELAFSTYLGDEAIFIPNYFLSCLLKWLNLGKFFTKKCARLQPWAIITKRGDAQGCVLAPIFGQLSKREKLLRLSHLYESFKIKRETFCHRMIWIQCPSLSTIFTKCNIISIFICDCQISSCNETLIVIDKMNSSYSGWFALDAKLYIPSAIKN